MRKVTLTNCFAFALSLAAISAFAGPVAMEKNVAPAPMPACTWTGFYVGVNGGVGQLTSKFTDQQYFWGGDTTEWDNTTFMAGGQLGYNYQWEHLVVGIEADADYHGNTISKTRPDGEDNEGMQDHSKVDFVGTVRLRIGVAVADDKALIYMTAGGAYAHGNWNEHYFQDQTDNSFSRDVDWQGDDWRWGWTAGFGIEYKLNCHWSIRAESLYTWLTEDETAITSQGSSRSLNPNDFKFTFSDNMFDYRVGVNYSFGSFFGR
jgi:outer membrane immunogenic protein